MISGAQPNSFYHRMIAGNNLIVPTDSGIAALQFANSSSYRNYGGETLVTPKSHSYVQNVLNKGSGGPLSVNSEINSLNFSGIGSSIILRKTEYYQP